MLVLGVDPGQRCGVGWVVKAENGVLVPLGSDILQGIGAVNEWLDHVHLSPHVSKYGKPIMVCEDFIQRPKFDGLWTPQHTAKMIGLFERQAHILGWHFWTQQPSVLPIGCKIMAIPYNSKTHLKDNLSALAHAGYFARNGARKAS